MKPFQAASVPTSAFVRLEVACLDELRSPVRRVNPKAKELRWWVTKDPDSWMLKGVRHDALSDGRGGGRHSHTLGGREWGV